MEWRKGKRVEGWKVEDCKTQGQRMEEKDFFLTGTGNKRKERLTKGNIGKRHIRLGSVDVA